MKVRRTNLSFKRTHRGFSLVEALIGIALLGVVLVPMLFLSSSYFLNQLNKTRQSMEVSHNTAQFLNRFMEEIYQTSRLLPGTDSTHIYFSYYDSVAQREVKAGYQIRTPLGYTNPILERLVYNTSTLNWDAMSPYAFDEASKILLPVSSTFTYCADNSSPTCTAAPYNNALLVRLKNWSFSNLAGSQSLSLSTDLDIYISAAASPADSAIISQAATEMYKIDATQAFDSNANLALLNISPFTGQLNDMTVSVGGGAGILSTIFIGADDSNYSMQVASDGRLYTGVAWEGNTGSFITYHPSTGVSTIVSGVKGPGNYFASAVSPVDGRVYFGESSSTGKFWTWQASTGLTTILSTSENWPGSAATAVASDGRVYIGGDGGKMWSWKAGVGLTTINLGAGTWSFTGTYKSVYTTTINDRVYFNAKNTASGTKYSFFTWAPSDGTSIATVLKGDSSVTVGDRSAAVNPVTGGIYFAEGNVGSNSHLYYWDPAVAGTTTIVNSSALDEKMAMDGAITVAADGRVFFGSSTDFWTWKPGETTNLTPIFSSGVIYPGRNAIGVTPGGTVYFSSDDDKVRRYDINSPGITTVFSGDTPGKGQQAAGVDANIFGQAFIVRSDGRIFFGDDSTASSMWTWQAGTGLSTIWTRPSDGHPGHSAMVIDDNGRLYFAGDTRGLSGNPAAAKPLFTWHESTGLSTIIDEGIDCFGIVNQMKAIPGATGGVYVMGLGDMAHGYPIWRWVPGTPTIAMRKANETGTPNKSSITLNMSGSTYVASIQDTDGNLFYVDSGTEMVDRYTNTPDTSGNAVYSRASEFSWDGNATTIAAAAIDENTTGIALLDSDNKQIDIYSNRLATGSPSPGGFSVATQSTLPTGLANSSRTGNYLVLDSTIRGAGVSRYVNLNIYNNGGSYLRSIPIVVATGGANALSVDATGETNFKITLDSRRNILYLSAPSLSKIFAFSMPEYL